MKAFKELNQIFHDWFIPIETSTSCSASAYYCFVPYVIKFKTLGLTFPRIVATSCAPMMFKDYSSRSMTKSSPVAPKTPRPSWTAAPVSADSANRKNYSPARRRMKTWMELLWRKYKRENSVPASSGDVATLTRQFKKEVRKLSFFKMKR